MSIHNQEHPIELLPWLVNGTLDEVEQAQVQRHVNACPACRRQVEFLSELRAGVKDRAPADAGDLGLQRLMRSVRAQRGRRAPRWMVPAAAAAGLLLVVQSLMLMHLQTERQGGYEPLSGAAGPDGAWLVEFAPQATEASIRALLRQAGARIVDGPSAAGLYRIELEDTAPGRADPAKVMESLRAQTQVILHIQSE